MGSIGIIEAQAVAETSANRLIKPVLFFSLLNIVAIPEALISQSVPLPASEANYNRLSMLGNRRASHPGEQGRLSRKALMSQALTPIPITSLARFR